MRKLNLGDIFAAARLIRVLDAPDKIRSYLSKAGKVLEIEDKKEREDAAEELGKDAVMDLLAAAGDPAVEAATLNFLAGPFQMKSEDVRNLEIPTLLSNVQQLIGENSMRDFIEAAGKSMSKM